ncbi:MAG: exodeoxyribonuclease III [Tepidimonas sp.]|uniref:exodeoxyribonuclease III n=1 Tax=Tepidimonas sp. TaxID=2002775 RepID=UPI004054D7B7
MQLATWNINSLSVRLPHLLDWLAARAVDVVALQELKLTDDKFPVQALERAGYTAAWFGQKTYNGVALLVRVPGALSAVQRNIPGFPDDQARVMAATVQPAPNAAALRVIGAYVPNGQAPGSDKFAYKMRWLEALRGWVAQELARHPRLVLMGDFNITVDDDDVWDPEGLRDTIHCTREERAHLQALKDLGLYDALRLFPQPPKSFTWWDYRQLAFAKNRGMRIDHIFISDELKNRAIACCIDREMRKRTQPSDHAPVVLTLADE